MEHCSEVAFLLLYIIIKAELLYEVFGMIKFLKSVFNSFTASLSIVCIGAFSVAIIINFSELSKSSFTMDFKIPVIITLICFFFLVNAVILNKNQNKRDYPHIFTTITIRSILFFVVALTLGIVFFYFILKTKNFKERPLWFSYFYFTAISYTAWVWCVYLNFCIRVLSSINVKCSVFVAITVKSILIAIVAWLALYKNSGIDKNRIISFIASYISLCYPIIDMYKYVRLELDKYIEDNNNPIQIKSYSD